MNNDSMFALPHQLQWTTDRVGGNVLIFERTREHAEPTKSDSAATGTNAFNVPPQREANEL